MMKFRRLLTRSRRQIETQAHPGFNGFNGGARWMISQLHTEQIAMGISQNYLAYGFFKYLVSFAAMVASAFFFYQINAWVMPLCIVVFYLVEVHFLFLFPLLIDNVKHPILRSIKETYRTGLFTALFTVIPIGFYMMIGLLRLNDPFRNWYAGCLAIVLWYNEEVRNRI